MSNEKRVNRLTALEEKRAQMRKQQEKDLHQQQQEQEVLMEAAQHEFKNDFPANGENWTREEILAIYPELPEVRGHFVLLRIFEDNIQYARDVKGNITTILLPETSQEEKRYHHVVGLVVGIGPEAYNQNETRWCDYGEYHIVDRYDGKRFVFDRRLFMIVPDDKVNCKTDYPEKCSRF